MSEDKWIVSPVLKLDWVKVRRWVFMSGNPLRVPLEWNPLPLTTSGTSALPFIVSPSPFIRSVTCRALISFQLGLGPFGQEGLCGGRRACGLLSCASAGQESFWPLLWGYLPCSAEWGSGWVHCPAHRVPLSSRSPRGGLGTFPPVTQSRRRICWCYR